MRARRHPVDVEAAVVARRRLELLGAELGSTTPPRPAGEPETTLAGTQVGELGDRGHAEPGRHAKLLSPSQRSAAWLADALPSTLRGRLGITSQHVTVIALVVAAALAAAALLLVRSRPEPVVRAPQAPGGAVLAPPTAAATGLPAGSATEAGVVAPSASAAPAEVVVDVAGRVRHPGVVVLPAGSRVIDALEAVGGARPKVELASLNLARVLVDGEQILVGLTGRTEVVPPAVPTAVPTAVPPALPTSADGPALLVNLNTATPEQLDELPGVGPVTSAAIIEWRTQHGGFTAVEELLEVSGIGEVTLADLRPHVTV